MRNTGSVEKGRRRLTEGCLLHFLSQYLAPNFVFVLRIAETGHLQPDLVEQGLPSFRGTPARHRRFMSLLLPLALVWGAPRYVWGSFLVRFTFGCVDGKDRSCMRRSLQREERSSRHKHGVLR